MIVKDAGADTTGVRSDIESIRLLDNLRVCQATREEVAGTQDVITSC